MSSLSGPPSLNVRCVFLYVCVLLPNPLLLFPLETSNSIPGDESERARARAREREKEKTTTHTTYRLYRRIKDYITPLQSLLCVHVCVCEIRSEQLPVHTSTVTTGMCVCVCMSVYYSCCVDINLFTQSH